MTCLLLGLVLLLVASPVSLAQPLGGDDGTWIRFESLNPLIDDDFGPLQVTNRSLLSSAQG